MSLSREVVVVVGSGQGVRNRSTRRSGDRVQSHDSPLITTLKFRQRDCKKVRCMHEDRLR